MRPTLYGANKMNMISTGAFLPEMDASNKQETTAEKFARVWEKKNAKAARAGGVSLMALSLAACGSSSEEAAPVVAPEAPAPAEPEAPAVTVVRETATTETDIFNSFTTGNDSLTINSTGVAATETYNANDVYVDDNSTDTDTLTINAEASLANTPTIVGFEVIEVNAQVFASTSVAGGGGFGSLAANDFELDADGITGGTVTVNVDQPGSDLDGLTVTNAGDITLVAGTDIAIMDVTMTAGAATVVNLGSADEARVTGGATDTITVVANGDAALTAATSTTLAISATEASEITLTAAAATTITGDANTTLSIALANLDGDTVTGAAAVSGVLADNDSLDLTGVASAMTVTDSLTAANDVATLEVADGASVTLNTAGVATGTITLSAQDDDDADTENAQAVTVTVGNTVSAAVVDYLGTLAIADSNSTDSITTVNLVLAGDQTGTAIDMSGTAADSTINVSGAGDTAFTITTGGGDVTFNGASATGALTGLNTAADLLAITTGAGADEVQVDVDDAVVATGAGNDTITVTADVEASIDGGAGTDTVVATAARDYTDVTLAGIEVIDQTGGAGTFNASQLSGATYVFADAGGAAIAISAGNTADVATIDLSGLTFADATNTVTVSLASGNIGTSLTAGTAFNYTGSAAADTVTGSGNADTIDGGAGVDSITGAVGADILTGGAGSDTFVFAATHSTEAAMDKITDFSATAASHDTIDNVSGGAAGAETDDIAIGAATDVSAAIADAVGGETVGAYITNGVMKLTGAQKGQIDTLAEWIDAALLVETATADTLAFEFGGNTYIIEDDGAGAANALVSIVELTGVTGIEVVDAGAGNAAANTVIIA
jgi:Ca2+-binding RTX toxin-like protein